MGHHYPVEPIHEFPHFPRPSSPQGPAAADARRGPAVARRDETLGQDEFCSAGGSALAGGCHGMWTIHSRSQACSSGYSGMIATFRYVWRKTMENW